MEHELWVDGSVNNDLTFAQLAQILNINHFITSQPIRMSCRFFRCTAANKGPSRRSRR